MKKKLFEKTIQVKTNADRIRSMTDDELANYLFHINGKGYNKDTMLQWLKAIYVSDRIKIIIPDRQYEGDFGTATSWDDAYNQEINWLQNNGYTVQEGVGEVGRG